MVSIEENHELLDIILGYKPDKYSEHELTVTFYSTQGLDLSVTLVSPSGEEHEGSKDFIISEVGLWSYTVEHSSYLPVDGSIMVTKSMFGKHTTIPITLERSGDVYVYGDATYLTIDGEDIAQLPVMDSDLEHFVYTRYNLDFDKLEDIHIYDREYSYYDNSNTIYKNELSIPGFMPHTYYYETATDDKPLQTIKLIPEGLSGAGIARIELIDAITGQPPVGNIFGEFGFGFGCEVLSLWAGGWSEESLGNISTFDFPAQPGYYTVKLEGDYYLPSYAYVTVLPGRTYETVTMYLIPKLSAKGLKAVLSWGDHPSDLDSHLRAYKDNYEQFHVYYSDKDYIVDGVTHVNLDVDDTDYYGPETTSIYYKDPGFIYYYYIYDYSGTDGIPEDAYINIYDEGNLIYRVDPPTEHLHSSSYRYWKVFSYNANTEEIKIRNKIVSYEPQEHNWGDD